MSNAARHVLEFALVAAGIAAALILIYGIGSMLVT